MIGTLLLTALIAQGQGKQDIPYETDALRKPSLVTNGSCLIKGGTVVTITNGTIPNADVLIQNGKIVGVGPNLSAPAGTKVIDAKGKFVTPGIVDAHSHMAATDVNEFSDAVTPEVRMADVLDPESSAFLYKLASGFTSALVLHGSANPIGGESQIIKLRYKRPLKEILFPGAPRVVKFALGENVKQSNGSSPQDRFPATRMGVEAVYRRSFDQAREYMAAWDKWNATKQGPAPRKDMRLEALANILRRDIIVHCHSYRQDEILMMARLSQEYGFKLAAFTHGLEAYKVAPELAQAGIGVSCFSDAWAYKAEVMDAIAYNAALCTKAGVVTSINTDTFSGMTQLFADAAKTIRFGGLTPDEAMRLVTINPAIQLGIDKRVGSLEVGKDGDIAVWSGHPLSVYSRCDMTLVDGDVFFQRTDRFGLDKSSKYTASYAVPASVELAPIPSDAKVVAIVNADVYPVTGSPIQGGSVLIEGGKITAVGKNVTVPAGAVTLDAKGLRVYPGLFDAQSQIGRQENTSFRSTRDTTEIGRFQPDVVALTAVDPESSHIPVTRLGGITHTMQRPLGLPVSGQGSVAHLAGWTTEQMGIQPKAALFVNFPAGTEALPWFFLESMSPDEKKRRDDFAKEQRESLREYLESAKRYLTARREDPEHTPHDTRLDALAPYLSGQKPTVISASNAETIKEAIKFAEDLGLRMVLSASKEAWRIAPLLAEKKIPVILPLAAVSGLDGGGNTSSRDYDPWDAYLSQPALLARAGVTIAFGSSDSAGSYDLAHRAGMACAYGLPYDEALKALTINPAKIFGVDDKVGSIEAGKIANVIVVDGDPLETTTQVRALFINGQSVPLTSKWSQLYDKYKQRLK